MLMWWRTWHDTERRLWAERQMTGDPAEGKRGHADDKQFRWTTPDMRAPAVTPLEFTDENGKGRFIASAFARDNTDDRQFLATGAAPHRTTTSTTTPPPPTTPAPTPADDDLPF